MAIRQYPRPPHTPTDQAHIESFKCTSTRWPHLDRITHPVVLEGEPTGVRVEDNTMRLRSRIEQNRRSQSPATLKEDVDAHSRVFDEMAAELTA
jgi:hypothetical protein